MHLPRVPQDSHNAVKARKVSFEGEVSCSLTVASLLQVAAYSLSQGVPLQNRGESHITVSVPTAFIC